MQECLAVQIIFVDKRLSAARTITLTRGRALLMATAAVLAVLLAVCGLYAVTFRAAAMLEVPILRDMASFVLRDEIARNEQFVRDNVSAMARRLGEMQAQLMRLDALGERVSRLAGISPTEFNFKEIPGRGGAAPGASRALTLDELQAELDRVSKDVDSRSDYLDVVAAELLHSQVRGALLPKGTPVASGFIGSGFGQRTDPFTGESAMHAGIDFAAPSGTPILAAAGGVISDASHHPAYGNQVEIDHGNGLSTLYAHASKLLVKPGQIVRAGDTIALVGSTGRSTGSHLHFEVHVNGAAQNPARFLTHNARGTALGNLAARSR
jgi:murein DD-endopeptidase MepM/ murein hydrolase activator NlpD